MAAPPLAPIVGPPASKKRKMMWATYDEFIDIIQRLGNDYDPLLFGCLDYDAEKGVTCSDCCAQHPIKKK